MAIILRHVFKQYKQFKNNQALVDVSLRIDPEDKMVALIGPSGSGKSTLLNLIAALDKPNSGEIIVNSRNILRLNRTDLAQYRLHDVGIVFQFFYLFPTLTIFENIAVPGYLANTSRKNLKKEVEAIADLVGIRHLLNRHPHEISGGEAQRTAICRALINKPKLLLADEPTGNLDTETAHVIFSLMQTLVEHRRLTAIIATHDLHLLKKVNKTIELKNGHIL
ncbi:ABC transporter ATP-binding protein [Legionella impletisoli]|uniref:Cell division ATP-binding protein FtsE n=1 Tax=Legionella impletisoli TaxID=343510 RepID=A0A917JWW6_9GAMM|nr:ABC transporter ATP-binding protein [Legionella impletisoli]GGI88018.1 ABC transporter ATP-binding protein [Legionella impletisoli]